MGALDPGEDGLAQLKALLGSDDWGCPGMSSAQAALAQASSAIVPALRTGSVRTLEPDVGTLEGLFSQFRP